MARYPFVVWLTLTLSGRRRLSDRRASADGRGDLSLPRISCSPVRILLDESLPRVRAAVATARRAERRRDRLGRRVLAVGLASTPMTESSHAGFLPQTK